MKRVLAFCLVPACPSDMVMIIFVRSARQESFGCCPGLRLPKLPRLTSSTASMHACQSVQDSTQDLTLSISVCPLKGCLFVYCSALMP